MIQLHDVEFTYPEQEKATLQIPFLQIEKKEKVFIYGPSGCGKSTFLEILAGVLLPQKGRVQIADTEMQSLSSQQRDRFRAAHMSYIFQSFNLIPFLNVQENILLPGYLSSQKRQYNQDMQLIVQRLGIESLMSRPVTQLSVGQQQRVAAARALYGRPQLILADEPTSSLDYDHREKFISILFDLCQEQGTTLLFVSHDRTLEKLFSRSLSFLEINKVSGR